MGLAKAKPLVVPMLERNAGHQDDAVPPQFASMSLPIGMATAKPTADGDGVHSILLMVMEAVCKDQ
jgi:hypothetical protein